MTGDEYLIWVWRQVRATDRALTVAEWAILCGITPTEAEHQLRSVARTHLDHGHPLDDYETWRKRHG